MFCTDLLAGCWKGWKSLIFSSEDVISALPSCFSQPVSGVVSGQTGTRTMGGTQSLDYHDVDASVPRGLNYQARQETDNCVDFHSDD